MSETWTPREPSSPAAPTSRARRTIVLWVVLLAFFLVIYIGFDESPTPGRELTSDPAPSLLWVWGLGALCFALPTAVFLWHIGGSQRFTSQQGPALEALGDGQYARAAQLFGDLAQRYRARPNLGLLAAFNQGFALIRAGDSAAAVGVLLGIERWPNLTADGARRLAALELARAFAIGGDVDKARRWLDTARERRALFGDQGHEYARLAEVEGLVLCRAGAFDDAIRHYDRTWERLQSRLTISDMRAVWLLRAFAARCTSAPRDAAAPAPWLDLLRATQPGSLAWVTATWPELAAFAEQELGGGASSSSSFTAGAHAS